MVKLIEVELENFAEKMNTKFIATQDARQKIRKTFVEEIANEKLGELDESYKTAVEPLKNLYKKRMMIHTGKMRAYVRIAVGTIDNEALQAVSAVSAGNLSEYEIDVLLQRYGSNYWALKKLFERQAAGIASTPEQEVANIMNVSRLPKPEEYIHEINEIENALLRFIDEYKPFDSRKTVTPVTYDAVMMLQGGGVEKLFERIDSMCPVFFASDRCDGEVLTPEESAEIEKNFKYISSKGSVAFKIEELLEKDPVYRDVLARSKYAMQLIEVEAEQAK